MPRAFGIQRKHDCIKSLQSPPSWNVFSELFKQWVNRSMMVNRWHESRMVLLQHLIICSMTLGNHIHARKNTNQHTHLALSENRLNPYTQWLMIIIPIKWLFHWEYTLFSDKLTWLCLKMGYPQFRRCISLPMLTIKGTCTSPKCRPTPQCIDKFHLVLAKDRIT